MTEEVPLGVIVPSVNTVVENWYPQIVPDGVSMHFARMLIADGSSPEEIIAMDREYGVRAIHQIATCRPHAIAYGCTASWRLLRLARIRTPIHGFRHSGARALAGIGPARAVNGPQVADQIGGVAGKLR